MNCFYLKRYGLKAKGFLTQSPPFFAVKKKDKVESSENSVRILLLGITLRISEKKKTAC